VDSSELDWAWNGLDQELDNGFRLTQNSCHGGFARVGCEPVMQQTGVHGKGLTVGGGHWAATGVGQGPAWAIICA
jgi:hypothetical protein